MEDHQPSSNIASTIFHDLRKQILSGKLAAGERLPGERELATHYGTNRNTLREAVRRLEQARLVSVRHGQGLTVADFRRSGTMELLVPYIDVATELRDVVQLMEDILPARIMVLEFASRLAARRATPTDVQRLQDISDLLVAAFDRGDPVVVAHGFQRWLEALIDAAHSLSIRWIANPFLDAYRQLMDRFPALWILDPSFPSHLAQFMAAIDKGDEEEAVKSTHDYYAKIDDELLRALGVAIELGVHLDDARSEAQAEVAQGPSATRGL